MYIRFAVAALVIGTSLYLLVELANCQFSGTLTPTRAGHMWLQTASLIGSSNLLATGLDPWPPQHRPNGTLLKQPWVSGGQENPCVPALHHLSPRGDYEYHPSDVEKEWMKFPRRKKICKTAREQQEQSRIWMNYTASVFKANQRPDREPMEEEARDSWHRHGRPENADGRSISRPASSHGRTNTNEAFGDSRESQQVNRLRRILLKRGQHEMSFGLGLKCKRNPFRTDIWHLRNSVSKGTLFFGAT